MVASKGNRKYNLPSNEDVEESTSYLDIWRVNPAYKDISQKMCKANGIFLIFITFFLMILTILLTPSLYLSLGLGVFLIILFFIAFHDDIYSLEHGFKYIFRDFAEMKPFEKFHFYTLEEDPATVLIINKKDMITMATRLFKVEVLAENINPTINQFLHALDQSKMPYTYQVVQKPILMLDKNSSKDKKEIILQRSIKNNTIGSYQTLIYFSVYYPVKGVLSKRKLFRLIETIISYSNDLKSNFSANFHHTNISLLKREKKQKTEEGEEEEKMEENPINAIRTLLYGIPLNVPSVNEINSTPNLKTFSNVLRLIFTIFIISALTFFLLQLNFPLIYTIGLDIAVLSIIIILWWREVLFYITHLHLKRYRVVEVHPFSDVRFYKFKSLQDSLYIHINNDLLIATQMFNLRNTIQPSFSMPDKFFRAMNNQKTPFIYTLNATPIGKEEFVRYCAKSLNDKTREELEGIIYRALDQEPVRRYKNPQAEYLNWMEKRTGMWRTFLTISTSSYKFTNAQTIEDLIGDFFDLEDELCIKAENMRKVFQENFKKHFLIQLRDKLLISGFVSECVKNHEARLNGTHLNLVYFQGKRLAEIANIANEFKKGIETRVAAEFNTPLHLENFITIGHTINTEFLEKEVPAGFTLNQLKRLLITNGTSEDRELITMKIVAELIKVNVPSVVFDFTGEWSKLIRYFEGSMHEDSFEHFKFGQAFNINLINSGLENDRYNFEYLNYFYDVFALAFKVQKQTIKLLKKTIRENDQLDFSSISLDMMVRPEYTKNYYSENLLDLLREFVHHNAHFSDKALEHENDIAPLDFIKSEKTVILDLSLLKDLEQKIFTTFAILSKFIHHANHSHEFHEKILFIPNIDLFFDQYYIDNNNTKVNYGTINNFLDPLLEHGFGLICSANQARYLHSNVFNYLRNIITLRATDSRDIAILRNEMRLQELQGTGYYSAKRNNTYQIDYLMTMRSQEIIVKRDDIYQPFPVEIESRKISKTLPLSDEKIHEYMEEQGYNLQQSEQKLSAKLKHTIFEKDFGIYDEFIKDVKKFLDALRKVQGIGNLSKQTLKDQLKKFIYTRASKRTKNKSKINSLRNEIFKILIKQGYLVEAHPDMASGSQAIITSYKIGEKYQRALDDEFKTRGNFPARVDVEVIQRESEEGADIFKEFDAPLHQERINFSIYNSSFIEQVGHSLYVLFKMKESIENEKFEKAINQGKLLIKNFLMELYKKYEHSNQDPEHGFENAYFFVEYLIKHQHIPFTREDIKMYFEKAAHLISEKTTIESKARKLYDLNSNFISKFMIFLNKDNGDV